ncbi:MAG: TatD family hydrolase [Phycicoccus sp.]|nr:TatD family hydrolase [Phycicoccus sp.]NMM35081.1 TatD family hydrolase [Phycicoccus sp.]
MSGSGRSEPPPAPDALPIPVVDNHTHLDIARDGSELPDIQAVIDDATAVGVPRMIQIGCDLASARFTVDVIERYAALLGGVALHPNEAPRLHAIGELDSAKAEIERLASHPRVRVIGETGLDYFRTAPEGIQAQQDSFRWHIDLAKRTGKVLQVHDRDAHEDVLRILSEEGAPEHTVLHCFSGDIAMARECVDLGYHLSFSGTVTFKNARGLRNALSVTPMDNLLVETDAPFLTPAPHRGAINAPYLVPLTVRAMADVLNVDVPALCTALAANSERIYGRW